MRAKGNRRSQGARSNRACGFPAHGLPVIGRHTALCGPLPEGLPRVGDRAAQAIEAQPLEVLARPAPRLAGPQVTPFALAAQGAQPSLDEAVEAEELIGSIAGAKVRTPSP